MSRWFNEKVMSKNPNFLGGWKKNQPAKIRRKNALNSTSKRLTLNNRRLSAGRLLQALSKLTNDKQIEILAKRDANYFFKLLLKK